MDEHQSSPLQYGQAHWTFDASHLNGDPPFGGIVELDRFDCSSLVEHGTLYFDATSAREFSRIIFSCLAPYRWTISNVHPIGYLAFLNTRDVITATIWPKFVVASRFVPLVLGRAYTEAALRAYLDTHLSSASDTGALQFERRDTSLHCYLYNIFDGVARVYYVHVRGENNAMVLTNAIAATYDFMDENFLIMGSELMDMDPKDVLERLVQNTACCVDFAAMLPYTAFDVVPQSGLTPSRTKLCRSAGAKSPRSPGNLPIFPAPLTPLDNE